MHILITDSGVGGLSVVAYAERFIRTHGFSEPVRLTFANAAPANDYGYNAMKTRAEKIETFDRFLRSVHQQFTPDSIYIACNTLSVLLPDTPFMSNPPVPVRGIVETGVRLVAEELAGDTSRVAIIFATQTTIDAGTYARELEARGIAASRIISQACPGLADTISADREGTRTRAEIERWVDTALAQQSLSPRRVVAALACTHYGYRRDQFQSAFERLGVDAVIINPNESATDELLVPGGAYREAAVRFVTRYRIPAETIDALTYYLGNVSPATVDALRDFEHRPDLF